MDTRAIGIFDSGVGGLTVVKSLLERLPRETLCYFGDTARVPYGTKSADTVRRYTEEITDFLISHGVKIVLAACNTVSAVALPQIEARFSGPVVGVVEPGVRAALGATRNGRIGVIGTRGAIQSGAYQSRLKKANPDLFIASQPCPLFVPLAEEGWDRDEITSRIAARYLEPLRAMGIDTLILGCTHYPLLREVIQDAVGPEVALVSSAGEAAREVEAILRGRGALNPEKTLRHRFYASDDIEQFERLCHRICGNTGAVFTEANADFFSLVQKIHRFRDTLFPGEIPWFSPETP